MVSLNKWFKLKVKSITYLTILVFFLSIGIASAKSTSLSQRDGFSHKIAGSVKVIPSDIACDNVNELSKMTSIVKNLKNHISLEASNSFSQTSLNFIFSHNALLPGENVRRTDIRFTSRFKI